MLLILHSPQDQRKPEAFWEVQCLPSFLGRHWKKGAAGRTQIRPHLHSSSLSCLELCGLSQAQSQQPAAGDGAKDTEVRGPHSIHVSLAREGHMPVKVQCPSYHFLTALLVPRHISFSPRDNSVKLIYSRSMDKTTGAEGLMNVPMFTQPGLEGLSLCDETPDHSAETKNTKCHSSCLKKYPVMAFGSFFCWQEKWLSG